MPGKVRGLYHWCKKVTKGYPDVFLVDMTTSWKSGLAFCALIHRFRPDLIDYDSLSAENPYDNHNLAYAVAEREFGILPLLDVDDMVNMPTPDRMSIATYLSQFYDYFKDRPMTGNPDLLLKSKKLKKGDDSVEKGDSSETEDREMSLEETEELGPHELRSAGLDYTDSSDINGRTANQRIGSLYGSATEKPLFDTHQELRQVGNNNRLDHHNGNGLQTEHVLVEDVSSLGSVSLKVIQTDDDFGGSIVQDVKEAANIPVVTRGLEVEPKSGPSISEAAGGAGLISEERPLEIIEDVSALGTVSLKVVKIEEDIEEPPSQNIDEDIDKAEPEAVVSPETVHPGIPFQSQDQEEDLPSQTRTEEGRKIDMEVNESNLSGVAEETVLQSKMTSDLPEVPDIQDTTDADTKINIKASQEQSDVHHTEDDFQEMESNLTPKEHTVDVLVYDYSEENTAPQIELKDLPIPSQEMIDVDVPGEFSSEGNVESQVEPEEVAEAERSLQPVPFEEEMQDEGKGMNREERPSLEESITVLLGPSLKEAEDVPEGEVGNTADEKHEMTNIPEEKENTEDNKLIKSDTKPEPEKYKLVSELREVKENKANTETPIALESEYGYIIDGESSQESEDGIPEYLEPKTPDEDVSFVSEWSGIPTSPRSLVPPEKDIELSQEVVIERVEDCALKIEHIPMEIQDSPSENEREILFGNKNTVDALLSERLSPKEFLSKWNETQRSNGNGFSAETAAESEASVAVATEFCGDADESKTDSKSKEHEIPVAGEKDAELEVEKEQALEEGKKQIDTEVTENALSMKEHINIEEKLGVRTEIFEAGRIVMHDNSSSDLISVGTENLPTRELSSSSDVHQDDAESREKENLQVQTGEVIRPEVADTTQLADATQVDSDLSVEISELEEIHRSKLPEVNLLNEKEIDFITDLEKRSAACEGNVINESDLCSNDLSVVVKCPDITENEMSGDDSTKGVECHENLTSLANLTLSSGPSVESTTTQESIKVDLSSVPAYGIATAQEGIKVNSEMDKSEVSNTAVLHCDDTTDLINKCLPQNNDSDAGMDGFESEPVKLEIAPVLNTLEMKSEIEQDVSLPVAYSDDIKSEAILKPEMTSIERSGDGASFVAVNLKTDQDNYKIDPITTRRDVGMLNTLPVKTSQDETNGLLTTVVAQGEINTQSSLTVDSSTIDNVSDKVTEAESLEQLVETEVMESREPEIGGTVLQSENGKKLTEIVMENKTDRDNIRGGKKEIENGENMNNVEDMSTVGDISKDRAVSVDTENGRGSSVLNNFTVAHENKVENETFDKKIEIDNNIELNFTKKQDLDAKTKLQQDETPIESETSNETVVQKNQGSEAMYDNIEVDKDLLKMAAMMAKKMAARNVQLKEKEEESEVGENLPEQEEKQSENQDQMQSGTLGEEVEGLEAVQLRRKVTEEVAVVEPPTPEPKPKLGVVRQNSNPEKRTVGVSFRRIQYFTRPTKKSMDDDEEGLEEVDTGPGKFASDFRKKMVMWNRKSTPLPDAEEESSEAKLEDVPKSPKIDPATLFPSKPVSSKLDYKNVIVRGRPVSHHFENLIQEKSKEKVPPEKLPKPRRPLSANLEFLMSKPIIPEESPVEETFHAKKLEAEESARVRHTPKVLTPIKVPVQSVKKLIEEDEDKLDAAGQVPIKPVEHSPSYRKASIEKVDVHVKPVQRRSFVGSVDVMPADSLGRKLSSANDRTDTPSEGKIDVKVEPFQRKSFVASDDFKPEDISGRRSRTTSENSDITLGPRKMSIEKIDVKVLPFEKKSFTPDGEKPDISRRSRTTSSNSVSSDDGVEMRNGRTPIKVSLSVESIKSKLAREHKPTDEEVLKRSTIQTVLRKTSPLRKTQSLHVKAPETEPITRPGNISSHVRPASVAFPLQKAQSLQLKEPEGGAVLSRPGNISSRSRPASMEVPSSSGSVASSIFRKSLEMPVRHGPSAGEKLFKLRQSQLRPARETDTDAGSKSLGEEASSKMIYSSAASSIFSRKSSARSHLQSCLQREISKEEDQEEKGPFEVKKSPSFTESDAPVRPVHLKKSYSDAHQYKPQVQSVVSRKPVRTGSIYSTIKALQEKATAAEEEAETKRRTSLTTVRRFSLDSDLPSTTEESSTFDHPEVAVESTDDGQNTTDQQKNEEPTLPSHKDQVVHIVKPNVEEIIVKGEAKFEETKKKETGTTEMNDEKVEGTENIEETGSTGEDKGRGNSEIGPLHVEESYPVDDAVMEEKETVTKADTGTDKNDETELKTPIEESDAISKDPDVTADTNLDGDNVKEDLMEQKQEIIVKDAKISTEEEKDTKTTTKEETKQKPRRSILQLINKPKDKEEMTVVKQEVETYVDQKVSDEKSNIDTKDLQGSAGSNIEESGDINRTIPELPADDKTATGEVACTDGKHCGGGQSTVNDVECNDGIHFGEIEGRCLDGIHCGETEASVTQSGYMDGLHCGETEVNVTESGCMDGLHCGEREVMVTESSCTNGLHCGETEVRVTESGCTDGLHCGETEVGMTESGCKDGLHCGETEDNVTESGCMDGLHCGETEVSIKESGCTDGIHCGETEVSNKESGCTDGIHCGETEVSNKESGCTDGIHCGETEVSNKESGCTDGIHCGETEVSNKESGCTDGIHCGETEVSNKESRCTDGIHCEVSVKGNGCTDGLHCGETEVSVKESGCADGLHCGETEVSVKESGCTDGLHCGEMEVSVTESELTDGLHCGETEVNVTESGCTDGIHCEVSVKGNGCADGLHCGETEVDVTESDCTDGLHCGEIEVSVKESGCTDGLHCGETGVNVTENGCIDGLYCGEMEVSVKESGCTDGLHCGEKKVNVTESGCTDGLHCGEIEVNVKESGCTDGLHCGEIEVNVKESGCTDGLHCGEIEVNVKESGCTDGLHCGETEVYVTESGCVDGIHCGETEASITETKCCEKSVKNQRYLDCFKVCDDEPLKFDGKQSKKLTNSAFVSSECNKQICKDDEIGSSTFCDVAGAEDELLCPKDQLKCDLTNSVVSVVHLQNIECVVSDDSDQLSDSYRTESDSDYCSRISVDSNEPESLKSLSERVWRVNQCNIETLHEHNVQSANKLCVEVDGKCTTESTSDCIDSQTLQRCKDVDFECTLQECEDGEPEAALVCEILNGYHQTVCNSSPDVSEYDSDSSNENYDEPNLCENLEDEIIVTSTSFSCHSIEDPNVALEFNCAGKDEISDDRYVEIHKSSSSVQCNENGCQLRRLDSIEEEVLKNDPDDVGNFLDEEDRDEDETDNQKFLIGREKDPSKSEVARLIQQSLEQDRLREEMRKREQERLQELQDKLQPRDEIMERAYHRHRSESVGSEREQHLDDSDTSASSDDEAEEEEQKPDTVEDEVEEIEVSEELAAAGEATPISMPSGLDTDNSVSSPEESSKPPIEVFDLQESSSEDISPDMESQALFVKLKEAQYKNSVLEAELAKLKTRIIVLENAESQKRQYEKKSEDMAARVRDMEKTLENTRKEINHYQDMLEGSQGQYIALEKRMKGDFTALEKKYHKAKKLIKEYQGREKDFIQERESLLQQQIEKDQQYDALVKSLKDRIFQLEGDLRETQKAAGLPVLIPTDTTHKSEAIITKSAAPIARSAPPTESPVGSPVGSPAESPVGSPAGDTESISSGSEISSAEAVTSPEEDVMQSSFKEEKSNDFGAIPQTDLLDISASRSKSHLASVGGLQARRPPTKRTKSQESDEALAEANESRTEGESGLETWIKHDSDSTVKKSDAKKRKAQQLSTDSSPSQLMPPPPPPPVQPPPSITDSDSVVSESSRDRQDSMSESSSTISQTSYDPSNPTFRSKDSEIPDTISIDTAGTTETQDSTASSGAASSASGTKKSPGKGISLPKLPFKFGSSGSTERDKGGIVLLSNRSLGNEDLGPSSDGSGITLISKKKIDTGYDFDGANTVNTEGSSSYMVSEMGDDDTATSGSYHFSGTPANEESPSTPSRHNQNQFQSCAILEWNCENVCHWLMALELEKYASLFSEKNISGSVLVQLDGNKLKTLGISNSKDRELLKKKIKELKLTVEKERKQQEKERKLQEKEQKAREKEQKRSKKK